MKKQNGKLFCVGVSVFVLFICLLSGVRNVRADSGQRSTGKEKMPRIEFLERVLEAMKLEPEEKSEEAYIARAKELGLISNETFKDYSYKITRLAAVKILVKADEYLHGSRIEADDISFIMEERITDISDIAAEKDRKLFAKGYALGFVKGKSDGDYLKTRTCTPLSKPYASTLIDMIEMLNDEEKRCHFRSDWQMLRISSENMPDTAEFYSSILDSYPNSYYDTCFHGMNIYRFDHLVDNKFNLMYPRMTKEQRWTRHLQYDIYGIDFSIEPLDFAFPCEIEDFCKEDGVLGMVSDEYRNLDKESFVKEMEEYFTHAFNVDYRTIRKDQEWQDVMRKYLSEENLQAYIEDCVNNKIILKCDIVAVDPEAIYFHHVFWGKVYCHVCVVSDIGLGEYMEDYFNDPIEGKAELGHLFPSFGPDLNEEGIWPSQDRHVFAGYYEDYQLGQYVDAIYDAIGRVPYKYDEVKKDTDKVSLSHVDGFPTVMYDYNGWYPNLQIPPYEKGARLKDPFARY